MSTSGTVGKALDLVEHLSRAPGPMGVSELGRALRMPKASVHRLLASLATHGYVSRVEDGRYRLGFRLVSLGLAALAREPVIEAARPELEAAARALGETLFLAVVRDRAIVVLDKVEGTGLLRVAPRVGDSAPVHATAVGKLYLALAPDALPPLATPLARFTARTLTSRAALDRVVAQVRRRGWAESREEWIAGLAFVAAPVLVRGELVATVAAGVPTARLRAASQSQVVKITVAAARAAGARLEGSVS